MYMYMEEKCFMIFVMDGTVSGGWQGEKTSEFFFVPNELKSSKKQHVVFLFFPYLGGGWVCQKQMWINPHFLTLPLK